MSKTSILLLALITTVWADHQPVRRQSCGNDYHVCMPQGATSQALPEVGPALASLYTDLVDTIGESGASTVSDTGPAKRQDSSMSFCCAQNSQCLLLSSFGVSFCWDHFTTNFVFPDGSYGSIVAGNYTSASGTRINLVYGNYETTAGATGNIYDGASAGKPDTSSMAMPAPFTSSGVGSAIPVSHLGTMTPVSDLPQGGDVAITAITLPSLTISAGPTACTRCFANSGGPTTFSGNVSNGGRPSIIIPPINGGRKRSFTLVDQDLMLMIAVMLPMFYV